jgi:hypothetical protein
METAMLASMGMQAGGMAFSASAARDAGKQEEAGYKANAAMMREEAKAKVEAGREEATILKERARALMSAQIAKAAAGGGGVGGSTAVVIADSAYQAERDAQMTLRNADVEAVGLKNRAALMDAYGKAARKAGNIRAIGSIFEGASNILPLYISYSKMGGLGGLAGNQAAIKSYGGLSKAASSSAMNNWLSSA